MQDTYHTSVVISGIRSSGWSDLISGLRPDIRLISGKYQVEKIRPLGATRLRKTCRAALDSVYSHNNWLLRWSTRAPAPFFATSNYLKSSLQWIFYCLILWAFQSLCRTSLGEPGLATDVTDRSIVEQLITLASETALMSAPPL